MTALEDPENAERGYVVAERPLLALLRPIITWLTSRASASTAQ